MTSPLPAHHRQFDELGAHLAQQLLAQGRVRVQGQAFIWRNWPKQFDDSRLVLR